tara:strand:- start:1390 stop:1581 length:192 start_codon:yes stop_codon:yes gene_type:complete
MKAKLEVKINVTKFNRHKAKDLLAEKLYNLCFDWVHGNLAPEITFVIDADEENKTIIKKEDIN